MACAEAVGGALLLKTLDGVKSGSKAYSVKVRGSSGDLCFSFPFAGLQSLVPVVALGHNESLQDFLFF